MLQNGCVLRLTPAPATLCAAEAGACPAPGRPGPAQPAANEVSPVGPLCSGDLIGVAADADLHQAEQLMREHAVRRLPVVNEGQVVGIVSIGDVAATTDVDSPLAAVSRAQPNT